MKRPDEPHHRGLLGGAGHAVLGREGVLAQERLVHEVGAGERQLLARRQRVLADDLGHALQARLLVEQREEAPAKLHPLRVAVLVPPRGELRRVLGIGLQGMHGRVEAGLGALHVERPERAHVALGVARHRLREVARGRADGAHHGDGAAAARQRLDQRRALVELREPRGEVGGIAGFAGQLPEPPRHLAQRLRPAAGGVGHERHVQPLVAEVLGHGDGGIDRGLARGHRHVRGVGDDDRALHELAVGARVDELRAVPPARRPSRCRARRSPGRRSRRRRSPWRALPAARSCRCRSRRGSRPCRRGPRGRARPGCAGR